MSQAPPAGISLATPGDWMVLELENVANSGWVASAINDRIDAEPELAPHRDELIEQVSKSVSQARAIGTEFVAVLATTRNEQPVVASVSLTHIRDVHDPVAAAAAHASAVQSEPDVLSTPTPLPVQLPAGMAGRSEHVREFPLPGGAGGLLVLSVQYLIAVPGTEDVAVLTFSSPTLAARAELVARFHAIAESVEFR